VAVSPQIGILPTRANQDLRKKNLFEMAFQDDNDASIGAKGVIGGGKEVERGIAASLLLICRAWVRQNA
jgi:hypothetical protein